MTRLVIAGVSTRAAAASAARAGFVVTAIDGYADRDQHPGVRAVALPRHLGVPFTAPNAVTAAASIDCDAVAYLSNFENHPEAVAALAANRSLLGNPPEVLRRARDPFTLAALFQASGMPVPNVSTDVQDSTGWMLKPVASGGGHGVRHWRPRAVVPRGSYLQERIEGTSGSVVFVAAGGRAATLGFSRQLIGDRRFGARGYRYCGNILAPVNDRQFANGTTLFAQASRLATVATSSLRLVGLNVIDFVARAGVPYPLEINPRWSASMELVERALNVNLFAAHAAACANGHLPASWQPSSRTFGKAIVFARSACKAGDTDAWLADVDIRDVPHPGDLLPAGAPVCTVFAESDDASSCEAALVGRANRIYADLSRWVSNGNCRPQCAVFNSND